MCKRRMFSCALVLGLLGCSESTTGPETTTDTPVDPKILEEYHAVIPNELDLIPVLPQPNMAAKLGDPASFPQHAAKSPSLRVKEICIGVKLAFGCIGIHILFEKASPMMWQPSEQKIIWKPSPAEDGYSTMAGYIKREPSGGDFRYSYAILRGTTDDINTMKPVLWGASNPSDQGDSGVMVVDMDANFDFEKANNPNFGMEAIHRGRMAIAYATGVDDKGNNAYYALSAIRNFIDGEQPDGLPITADYLHGVYDDHTNNLRFFNWTGNIDIDNDPAKVAAEDVNIAMAFLNEGTGRAEISATGGDLGADQATGVECWGKALEQTYLTLSTPAGPIVPDEGTIDMCGPIFSNDFTTLGIPNLSDVDPSLMAKLNDLAANGVPKP